MALPEIELEVAVRGEDVPFSRSRLLAAFGAGLFGWATKSAISANPALAGHVTTPPPPCYGYPVCHYCDGGWCYQYCYWPHAEPGGGHCHTYNQYWEDCYAGRRYRCRDWHQDLGGGARHCLCRGDIGAC